MCHHANLRSNARHGQDIQGNEIEFTLGRGVKCISRIQSWIIIGPSKDSDGFLLHKKGRLIVFC